MKHLLYITILAAGLMACVTKPTYITEVHMAEGSTLTNTVTVTKPVQVTPATDLDLSLIPEI